MSFCFLSTLFFSEHLLFLTVLFDFTTPGTYVYVPATQDPMTLVYDLISLTLFLVFYMTANSIYLREKNICSWCKLIFQEFTMIFLKMIISLSAFTLFILTEYKGLCKNCRQAKLLRYLFRV